MCFLYTFDKTIFGMTIEDPVWGYRALELFWKDFYCNCNTVIAAIASEVWC